MSPMQKETELSLELGQLMADARRLLDEGRAYREFLERRQPWMDHVLGLYSLN